MVSTAGLGAVPGLGEGPDGAGKLAADPSWPQAFSLSHKSSQQLRGRIWREDAGALEGLRGIHAQVA